MTQRSERVIVRDPDVLPAFGEGDLASRIIADETVGVDNVSVGVVEIAPGARGSRHVREVEEIVLVLAGEGRIVTDDESFALEAGQAAIVSPGVHHYHENTGTTTLRKLWIFAPQGPERAIRARGGHSDTDTDCSNTDTD